MLSDYIEFDLCIGPGVPADFAEIVGASRFFNISVINVTAPALFALLTSAPTLFVDISSAIEAVVDQIVIPPAYFENPNVTEAVTSLTALAEDFVAVANASCDISLTEQQIADTRQIFNLVLPIFFILSVECDFFNRTLVEQAVADAFVSGDLVFELNKFTDFEFTLHTDRIRGAVPIEQFAETLPEDIVFIFNDFCGFPPFSNTTLAQLDELFPGDLFANSPN